VRSNSGGWYILDIVAVPPRRQRPGRRTYARLRAGSKDSTACRLARTPTPNTDPRNGDGGVSRSGRRSGRLCSTCKNVLMAQFRIRRRFLTSPAVVRHAQAEHGGEPVGPHHRGVQACVAPQIVTTSTRRSDLQRIKQADESPAVCSGVYKAASAGAGAATIAAHVRRNRSIAGRTQWPSSAAATCRTYPEIHGRTERRVRLPARSVQGIPFVVTSYALRPPSPRSCPLEPSDPPTDLQQRRSRPKQSAARECEGCTQIFLAAVHNATPISFALSSPSSVQTAAIDRGVQPRQLEVGERSRYATSILPDSTTRSPRDNANCQFEAEPVKLAGFLPCFGKTAMAWLWCTRAGSMDIERDVVPQRR